jgi:hypothetical protein
VSAIARTEADQVPCRICEKPTPMLGTRLCDWCYELETRIRRDPELACKILGDYITSHGGGMVILSPSAALAGLTCQEDSLHVPGLQCGAGAAAVVWHQRDKRAYPMCAPCAWHNVKNRGGRLLMATDRRAIP